MTKTPVFLEQRPLGRSGHPTSILGLGTRRLGEGSQKEFVRVWKKGRASFVTPATPVRKSR